jgi:phosphotransferase system HPr (HPr) family protein
VDRAAFPRFIYAGKVKKSGFEEGETMLIKYSTINPLFEIPKYGWRPNPQKKGSHRGKKANRAILSGLTGDEAMKKKLKIPVLHQLGIHLRAGAQLVKVVSRFKSKILVSNGSGYAVNAKNLIDLLTIGAIYGSVLEFSAEGEDASEAIEAIGRLLREWKEKNGEI